MKTIEGDHLRGHLETLILSVLERGDAHGLEILRRLTVLGCGQLHLKEGSLYPALYRLEESGKIAGDWEAGSHGRKGARRRIYRLTSKGKRELNKGREAWTQFVQIIGAIVGAHA
jgi:PadR family transcriptional regulator, regulatory protein PadR